MSSSYFPTPEGVKLKMVALRAEDDWPLGGLLYTPEKEPLRDGTTGVVCIHGVTGEFYGGVPGFLSPLLAERGYICLSINMRNHGLAYANSIFEDCEKDIRAAIKFLSEKGFRKLFLVGHSLGVTEVVYYQGKTQDPSVKAIALYGGHSDLRGSAWEHFAGVYGDPQDAKVAALGKKDYEKFLANCRELVAQGKGDTLLIMPHPPRFLTTSAKTFLSYRAPESNACEVRWVRNIRVPILIVPHELQTTAVVRSQLSNELKENAISSTKCDLVTIEGAGHFFEGYEEKVAQITYDWLAEVDLPPAT